LDVGLSPGGLPSLHVPRQLLQQQGKSVEQLFDALAENQALQNLGRKKPVTPEMICVNPY